MLHDSLRKKLASEPSLTMTFHIIEAVLLRHQSVVLGYRGQSKTINPHVFACLTGFCCWPFILRNSPQTTSEMYFLTSCNQYDQWDKYFRTRELHISVGTHDNLPTESRVNHNRWVVYRWREFRYCTAWPPLASIEMFLDDTRLLRRELGCYARHWTPQRQLAMFPEHVKEASTKPSSRWCNGGVPWTATTL
jgi:hypothetical protein